MVSAVSSSPGCSGSSSSSTPITSPRSVTGARTVQWSRPQRRPGAITSRRWRRTTRSIGPPSKGSTLADSSPSRLYPTSSVDLPGAGWRGPSGTWASRTNARPDVSAIRNDTEEARDRVPISRVKAVTASTGAAAYAASSRRVNESNPDTLG